jgi:pimeloyl-ACP methyl ester carboxylesterase
MLAARSTGSGSPTLVFMHFLGGSAREWQEVIAELGPGVHAVTVDLPGFGGSAQHPGYTVSQMAGAIAELISSLHLQRYVLVGHSMSAKVAAVLASRAAQNAPGAELLSGLEGLVLIAPSPVEPEPIPDSKRTAMLANLGEPRDGDEARARSYITKNEARDIPEPVLSRAVEDVLRMNRAAWVAWLEHGSREDWAERVGVLTLPALIVVGEKDTSLGLDVQQQLTLPHYMSATLAIVPACGHLIPMEKPHELAALLTTFLTTFLPLLNPSVPAPYLKFIHSDRVSPRTRELLLERLEPRNPLPTALSEPQLQTLRAVVDRVIPQASSAPIDIAGFIEERLASGQGDGWRYDPLPPDRDAYAASLDALDLMAALLHERPFIALTGQEQDSLLTQIAAKGPIEAPHLFRWFEDLRADAVQAWMSHPATLARIGYSGIGIGGAHTPYAGFVSLGPGVSELWEPSPREGDSQP